MKYIIFIVGLMSSALVNAEDTLSVKTIEGITGEMLKFISCDKGEEKDWDIFRNLFTPNTQFVSKR